MIRKIEQTAKESKPQKSTQSTRPRLPGRLHPTDIEEFFHPKLQAIQYFGPNVTPKPKQKKMNFFYLRRIFAEPHHHRQAACAITATPHCE